MRPSRLAAAALQAWIGFSGATFGGQSPATTQDAERPPTAEDLRIIERADRILSDASKWNRADDRICKDTETNWSLFCAIEKATTEVLGSYSTMIGWVRLRRAKSGVSSRS